MFWWQNSGFKLGYAEEHELCKAAFAKKTRFKTYITKQDSDCIVILTFSKMSATCIPSFTGKGCRVKETSNEKVRMQLAGACSSFVPSSKTLIGCVRVLLKTAKCAVQMLVLYCQNFFCCKRILCAFVE